MPGGPSAGRDRVAPSVLDGGPERLDVAVQTQLLDEDVVPALVLRDDVCVEVPRPGHALLAGNQHGVQLDALSLVAEDDDVEPHDIHLDRCHPGHETRAFSERAVEADRDARHAALLADARILIRVRDGRAVVAGVADSVTVRILLAKVVLASRGGLSL